MPKSRIANTLLNAKYSLAFYVLTLGVAFFSRKIFLDGLGADFVGLSSTLQNILGFLNLAEMGIGVVIGVSLYKPLYHHDNQTASEIISIFGYLYRWIGLFILFAGIILGAFLPVLIPESEFNFGVVVAVYSVFLFSSLLSYFFNYKQVLLSADQKNYLVVSLLQGVNVGKTVIQIVAVLLFENYYLWVIIELLGGIVLSLLLNKAVKSHYPWLASNIRDGRKLLPRYRYVTKSCKQVFLHRVGAFAEWQLMPVLIYAVESSLSMVAMYGNYALLIDKGMGCVNQIYQATQASIGNLIAEGDQAKINEVFHEILSLRIFIGGISSCIFFYISSDFITCWLGSQYQLPTIIVCLLSVRLLLTQSCSASCDFGAAYGLFWDVWAPFVQIGILFAISIPLGTHIGLTGVLMGNIISYTVVYVIWKGILVQHWGMKRPCITYFAKVMYYWVAILACGFASHTLVGWLLSGITVDNPWSLLTIRGLLFSATISLLLFAVFSLISQHFKTGARKLAQSLHLCC